MTTPTYKSDQTPIEIRVEDLLRRMTLEEKVGQMVQLAAKIDGNIERLESWNVGSYLHVTKDMPSELQRRAENTRLGIPLIFGIDAIHGHCFDNNGTVFPTQLAISCSWNKELIKQMGEVTAKEVRACGIHWTFSPVLCVGRDTRWGRINETFGEDPWLVGELASELIKGYQGKDFADDNSILACAKHYLAYGESVGGRDSYEAEISKRKLLSIFTPPFEKAVIKARVATFMAGYQAIDGVPVSADSWLLRELPKEQWQMDGFIVTDWDNVGSLHTKQKVAANAKEAAYLALKAGNDMIMETPDFYQSAIDLVREGKIDECLIDDSVRRILRYKFRLGLFDKNRYVSPEKKKLTVGAEEHWQKSLNASRECLTLLSNNGVLPLNKNKIKNILLVGPNADDIYAQLGDWSFGSHQAGATEDSLHKNDVITVRKAFENHSEINGYTLNYLKAADCIDSNFNEIDQAKLLAKNADLVIACVGDTIEQCGEFHDRTDLNLSGQQAPLLKAMKESGKPLVVAFIASKPLAISWIKENADALLCCFNPGAKGGQAICEALFGDTNPSGKLTISFPYSASQLPVYYNKYEGWHAQLSNKLNGEERYIDLPESPLFSFGEGISYSKFVYQDLEILSGNRLTSQNNLRVAITIKNTSDYHGEEIIQLYINDLFSSVTTPIKNLRAFEKISLLAGESKRVELEVEFDDLSLVNAKLERLVEPGEFEVMVGPSSRDEDLLRARFHVK